MKDNRMQQIGDVTYESVSHEEIIKKLKEIPSVAITNIHEYGKDPQLLSLYKGRIDLTSSTPEGISCSRCVGNVVIDINNVRDLAPLYKKFLRSLGLKFGEHGEVKGDLVNFIENELGFIPYKKRALKDCYEGLRMVRGPLIEYLEKVGTLKTKIDLCKGHENLGGRLDYFLYQGHFVKRTCLYFPGLERNHK